MYGVSSKDRRRFLFMPQLQVVSLIASLNVHEARLDCLVFQLPWLDIKC